MTILTDTVTEDGTCLRREVVTDDCRWVEYCAIGRSSAWPQAPSLMAGVLMAAGEAADKRRNEFPQHYPNGSIA